MGKGQQLQLPPQYRRIWVASPERAKHKPSMSCCGSSFAISVHTTDKYIRDRCMLLSHQYNTYNRRGLTVRLFAFRLVYNVQWLEEWTEHTLRSHNEERRHGVRLPSGRQEVIASKEEERHDR
mmetsp:Transcript_8901/g.24079  ORF Transcript_8901/g.24079 Transcript_8901/m.24079 type:complete len:123 (-) Transcript_8901:303-671(-)